MEEYSLDFNKYRDRLKQIYPQYLENELEELFEYKVRYWVIIIDYIDRININNYGI